MKIDTIECDAAIIGGGFGGCAAALAACEAGLRVVMTEPTDWIGGQVTSQGVSALDEHRWIETFGGTRSYYRFRDDVRAAYIEQYGGPDRMPDGRPLNPGDGWVSRLCFEPRVGLRVLEDFLAPYIDTGRLMLLLRHTPISVDLRAGRIRQVVLSGPEESDVIVSAGLYLDATDLGELLPLCKIPYATGAESAADTGEPDAAPDRPYPERVQSFTMPFFLEYRPGEDHTIRKPPGYETWRDRQPFTLTLKQRDGSPNRFYMFVGDMPFWTYRRAFDSALFRSQSRPYDLALINWDSNDYYKENLIDRSPAQQARILREAKRLSLAFLYWLQTEAPHDAPRACAFRTKGFPGLRLVPEAVGTVDGLAKAPYIREGRRLLGYRRILEQDLIATSASGARAAHYIDSVGVGSYPIDLHRCAGDPTEGRETRLDLPDSLPFQIPLGALLSPAAENLIAAGKCLATTHLTNGCYRVHPVEWNIGESAGALAAYCIAQNLRPRVIYDDPQRLQDFQHLLVRRGVPLAWGIDVPLADRNFTSIQSRLLSAPPPSGTARFQRLQLLPDEQVSRREASWLLSSIPGASQNAALRDLLESWNHTHFSPFTNTDWNAALDCLGFPARDAADYPTFRQICLGLADHSG